MLEQIWKTLKSQVVHSNRYWKIKRDSFKTKSGLKGVYEYIDCRGGVIIIPIISDTEIIMIKQYRYPNKLFAYEFPAGGIISGKTIKQCAKEELEEETGYSCNKLEKIGTFYPYTGVSNEVCHVFVAKNLSICNKKAESTEEITSIRVQLNSVDDILCKTCDGKAITAWYLFKRRKGR